MLQVCLPRLPWFACALLILFAPAQTGFSASGPPSPRAVTFSKQVAPILFKHCASCHRPGEIGPFSLLNYKDAAKRANFLKDITAARRMPPWKPVHGFGEFQGERRLSAEEIKTIARWSDLRPGEGGPERPAANSEVPGKAGSWASPISC